MRAPVLAFWPDPADGTWEDIDREPVTSVAPDGAVSRGVLWTPRSGWKTAVVLSHPRGDFSVHYAAPFLVAAGYAVLGFSTRYVNNDTDCLHEKAVVDVEAMVGLVRGRGAEHVILLGNSGGGSLMCLAQATAAEQGRQLGDGFVGLAAHPGEGRFMLQVIDPSVTDESDPLSVDPALDMYNPDNGWRPWPNPCRYERQWLERYREAQRDRVARLDAVALRAETERAQGAAEAKAAEPGSREWNHARRRGVLARYMVIYRTLADPAYLDLSIDPDDRPMGTVWAFPDPLVSNYGFLGLARTMTTRGWLSTWSARSHADVARTMPSVTVPTLVVHPTADTEIRLHQAGEIYEACAAADKTYLDIKGADHYFRGRRADALEPVVDWLKERWQ